jgi:hypothetical protein
MLFKWRIGKELEAGSSDLFRYPIPVLPRQDWGTSRKTRFDSGIS